MSILEQIVAAKEAEYGLPSGLLDYVWQKESTRSGDLELEGPDTPYGKAYGPFQILSSNLKSGQDFANQADWAASYLRQGLDREGTTEGALAYYHGGPNKNLWGPKTQRYASGFTGNAMQQPMKPKPLDLPPGLLPMPSTDPSANADPMATPALTPLDRIMMGLAGMSAVRRGGSAADAMQGYAGNVIKQQEIQRARDREDRFQQIMRQWNGQSMEELAQMLAQAGASPSEVQSAMAIAVQQGNLAARNREMEMRDAAAQQIIDQRQAAMDALGTPGGLVAFEQDLMEGETPIPGLMDQRAGTGIYSRNPAEQRQAAIRSAAAQGDPSAVADLIMGQQTTSMATDPMIEAQSLFPGDPVTQRQYVLQRRGLAMQDGRLARADGGTADLPTQATNEAIRAYDSANRMLNLASQLKQMVRPQDFGIPGAVQKITQNTLAQIDAVTSMARADNAVKPGEQWTPAKYFNPNIPKKEAMVNMLAYMQAKTMDPSGRISDRDFEAAKASIDEGGLFGSIYGFNAKIDAVMAQAAAIRQGAISKLPQGYGQSATTENLPQGWSVRVK